MTRHTGAADLVVNGLFVEDYAVLDELLCNGSSKRKPRQFLTCRQCGRRTRNINNFPADANSWRVVPRKETRCPECLEREEAAKACTTPIPAIAKARYRIEIKKVTGVNHGQ